MTVTADSQYTDIVEDTIWLKLSLFGFLIAMASPAIAFTDFPFLKGKSRAMRIGIMVVIAVLGIAIGTASSSRFSEEYTAAQTEYDMQIEEESPRVSSEATNVPSPPTSSNTQSSTSSGDSAEDTHRQTDEKADLLKQLESVGYTPDDAKEIAAILVNVGITSATEMDSTDNGNLKVNRLWFNNHQVNFTTDNNKLFYVQITGWKTEVFNYGWYLNWRGKLKFGENKKEKSVSFDLYDSDTVPGGYIAYYDEATNEVRPWGE